MFTVAGKFRGTFFPSLPLFYLRRRGTYLGRSLTLISFMSVSRDLTGARTGFEKELFHNCFPTQLRTSRDVRLLKFQIVLSDWLFIDFVISVFKEMTVVKFEFRMFILLLLYYLLSLWSRCFINRLELVNFANVTFYITRL